MFDSHIDDLIENRVMNDDITSSGNKSSPSLKSIQPPISRGLKDLINHPPPKSNISDIGSVGSQNSSKSTTPQFNKKSKTTNSSIKFANRRDQSLREVVEEWRTDFYPDLSYDYFNENSIQPSSNSNNNSYNFNKNNEKEDDDDDDDDDENSTTSENDEDGDDDNDDNDDDQQQEEDNVKNNSTYNEYINNLNNMKDQKNEQEKKETLLEQRVKQWKSDIRSDILESSELFMEHLPQRIFEKNVISELPMTPSTKKEPIQPPNNKNSSNNNNNNNNNNNKNNNNSSSINSGKSQFEYWRDNFNKTMDEKMKEKKRTNKITITSNK
ncbi:hypothetical protein RB653_000396 [Dictyostelium firmibasis]|uniref:Uncharacterized protein n=1 Tax=Dictyostelium firmibasis TaxID=79012 RepID=A0AAN7U6Y3_9MYCE